MSEPTYTPPDAFGLLRSYSRHRDFVRLALTRIVHALELRAIEHDASKMLDDEFAGFARINAVAREQKFGCAKSRSSFLTRDEATGLCELACIGLAAIAYVARVARKERRRHDALADSILEQAKKEPKPDETVTTLTGWPVAFPWLPRKWMN